ncbi:M81 family metallopeptidase [Microbacterium horticulturae]|uniref:M81 family metallopeptidase n=1 Tax=Microbacterium horticulturae TaxID=3028316 RepID=A0ABY8BTC5_9MICO|nr:M81 family metallopeptidase [Microbacterium sp. KACC 23027]WEG07424.1 M81 family metallopeptidase [Microbacterium sp. KACC 23027]
MSDRREANEIWMGPLPARADDGLVRPRIGIGGISIESSTFSPHISGDEAFTIRTGDDLLAYYPFLDGGRELRETAEWVPLTHGRSLPGGAVDPATYRRMKDAIVAGIRDQGPFDGFFFDIHGAMSVVGMDDAEGDLATAVRDALGPDTLVSTSMDLHGNVSRTLLDAVDLITCYRMAPHEDWMNTKERAVHNLLARLRGPHGADPTARRPYKAWRQIPVLLPGEKTSTRLQPAQGIYDEVAVVEALPGVLDAAVWVGYAWADEPRCQAAVVVTGDDHAVIAREAERLARLYWDARDDFAFVGPTASLSDALDRALAPGAARPYLISDSGDNPTAGGAGDVSWTLGALLERADLRDGSRTVIHASEFDAAAVAQAVAAGIGGTVTVDVGGRVDPGPRGPVRITAEVFSITDGDPAAGTQVVLRAGSVHAIVTERRKPFHHLDDFRMLGLDPEAADVVIVKIGYLEPELYDLAADWTLALTPGGVDQDLIRLGHHRLAPGVVPFDTTVPDPDLTPVLTRRGEEQSA